MPLSLCSPDLLALAHQLADVSGDVIRGFYRTPLAIEGKADLSPVTAADRKAEQVLHVLLAQERPNDGIIGEEFGVERENVEYVWVIDPIDGTRAFVSGKPLFGTLIALLHEGVPVLGVIDQPILQERWIGAAGHETTLNGQRCRARSCASLFDAVVCMGAQAFPFGNAVSLDAYRRVAKKAKTTTVGGDCYSYGLLASGYIDVCIEHDLSLYDFAALVPVVEGAGGRMTDWQGKTLTRESKGQILAAGDSRMIDETVTLLEGVL